MVRVCLIGGGLNLGVETLLNQAASCYAKGDYGVAAGLFHEVLNQYPHHPEALHMLGVIALQAGRTELALQLIDAALTAEPNFPRAQFNRCVVLRLLKRDTEALDCARALVAATPDLAAAWDMLGQLFKEKAAHNDAAKCYAHAIGLDPSNAYFHGNYALSLYAKDDLVGAYLAARRAEVLDANYPPMLLGHILQAWGYLEQAAECFARTRHLGLATAEAATSEGMARLQMGDMERGWELYEQRPELDHTLDHLPRWQGQAIDHLLLYEDQGLGDVIQFLRYLAPLHNRVREITLRLPNSLQRLCRDNFPTISVIDNNAEVPAANARCRLSSLPYFFSTRLSTIPTTPYLTASPLKRAFWRETLASVSVPRIGFVWAGNTHFHNDYKRSINFHLLYPLLACGPHYFVSLQKDRDEDQSLVTTSGIFNAAPHLFDFFDTAALVSELDLVITVDTATAHLTGALGIPVFILLPFANDWRWLINRSNSPWYKSARLFRQKRPDDWISVIANVTDAVKKFIAGDRSILTPTPEPDDLLHQNPNALSLPL